MLQPHRFLALYIRGVSARDIAKSMNTSHETAYNFLRNYTFRKHVEQMRRENIRFAKEYEQNFYNSISDLYLRDYLLGATYLQLARKYAVAPIRIRRAMNNRDDIKRLNKLRVCAQHYAVYMFRKHGVPLKVIAETFGTSVQVIWQKIARFERHGCEDYLEDLAKIIELPEHEQVQS